MENGKNNPRRKQAVENTQLNIDSLKNLAHELLYMGADGSPIYSDDFTRLNREVYRLANRLYPSPGNTPEEEGCACLSFLMAYNSTIYNYGDKQERIEHILDRSWEVLDKLSPGLLKVQLLLYCYGEVYEKELLDEAREIIVSWGGRELSDEEQEMMELYNGLLQSPE